MKVLNFPIIGYMRSPYQEKFGIPRQPNLVNVESYIEMEGEYNTLLAFEGIEEFSHLWLLWQFHDNKQQDTDKFRPQVRPPRLGGNKKIGVFATRSMYRPSPIGLSVVKLQRIEKFNKTVRVYVQGSDLLNGTPILDIKPYIHYSDAIQDAESGYAQQQPSRLDVIWSEQSQQECIQLQKQNLMPLHVLNEIELLLSLDPRPAYQDDETRVYKWLYANLNISFYVKNRLMIVQSLEYVA